jgi:hypothetical protein
MHMAGGGDARGGGRGDARASCASPLGTPLVVDLMVYYRSRSFFEVIPNRDPAPD